MTHSPPKYPEPKYNSERVSRAVLFEILEHYPTPLTAGDLALAIVEDPGDSKEVDTATEAIPALIESGLVRYRDDGEFLEPTQAALRAHALLGV